MSEVISTRFKKRIEKFSKDLKSYSLVDPEEAVIEGFYNFYEQKFPYKYGLVTQKRLILIQKKYIKLDKAIIIPFNNIKEFSHSWERNVRWLISVAIPLGFFPIFYFIFRLMRNMSDPHPLGTFIDIIFWALGIFLGFTIFSNFYVYFKGEKIISIVYPGNTLKLRCLFTPLLRYKDLVLFKVHGGTPEKEGRRVTIEELYQHLRKYIKG